MKSLSIKVIDKLQINTTNGKYKWTPLHQYTDDLENPYMYHQHFVPSNSYSLKTDYGKFFLITFRAISKFPSYIESLLLCFVTNEESEIINDTSAEVLELRNSIQNTFICEDSSLKNTIIPSSDLENYLQE